MIQVVRPGFLTWVLAVLTAVMLVACSNGKPAASPETTTTPTQPGDARSRLSPDLLRILVDPGDKGPLKYTVDSDGNEWLVNPRNGYRYPVEDGVPVMLVEEGAKHRDPSAISQ